MSWYGIPVPYTDRADWLTKRREGIGASDVAAILNLSPYGSPFTVWADKTMGAEKEQTEAMRFGKRLEGVITEEFEEQTGLFIGGRELLVHHPEIEWAMATVDGLAYESRVITAKVYDVDTDVLANVEFKADGNYKRWDEIPVQHQCQCQWQMFVTGMDQTMLACLHGGRRFEVYEIEADPSAQQMMLDRVSTFREKYLIDPEAEPPEVDEHPATGAVIADLWADPTDDQIELSHAMYADVKEWEAAKVRAKVAVDEVTRLKNRIAVALQEATVGTWAGWPVVTFKQQTRKEHMVRESSFRVLRQAGKED